ncbi:MAG: manganese-binding transcriptional regulator MntR [Planctomycetota bacterium]
MSDKPPKHPFRRTRTDHRAETAEDYVEAIAEIEGEKGQCRAADLARLFAVSHVTVAKTLGRLSAEGYVETEPYAPVTLTAAGRRLANQSRNRHTVVLEFLEAIGVSREVAEVDAEGIEHHVSPETLRCMQALIDRQRAAAGETPLS